jgi:hypothetical protein
VINFTAFQIHIFLEGQSDIVRISTVKILNQNAFHHDITCSVVARETVITSKGHGKNIATRTLVQL